VGIRLEEITKRLFQPIEKETKSAASAAVGSTIEVMEKPTEPPKTAKEVNLSQLPKPMAAAVDKVFGHAAQLRSKSTDFALANDQLERLNKSVARTFEPLRKVYHQLSQVSEGFGSLHDFRTQLEPLAKDFEPIQLFQDQVTELTQGVHAEIGQIVSSLDSVRSLGERVNALAISLKQVSELQRAFAELSATFAEDHSAGSANDTAPQDQPTLH